MTWPWWLHEFGDPGDAWPARMTSLPAAALWWGTLERWPLDERIALFLVGLSGWEMLKLARYERWMAKGKPHPQPMVCDRVSVKAVITGLVGIAVWQAIRAIGGP